MKSFSSFLLVFALFTACMNEDDSFQKSPSGIEGTWKLVERYYSIGGPLQHEEVVDGREITFKEDLTFFYPSHSSCNTGVYKLDDGFLVMEYNCDDDYEGVSESTLSLKFEGNRMILTPVNPVCIEGCSSIYKKLKE